MKSQKEIKRLKKNIVENSAVNAGYYSTIIQNIPSYALIEAVKEIASKGLIKEMTGNADAENIIVTEAVKSMSFQDFKEVYKFFF